MMISEFLYVRIRRFYINLISGLNSKDECCVLMNLPSSQQFPLQLHLRLPHILLASQTFELSSQSSSLYLNAKIHIFISIFR